MRAIMIMFDSLNRRMLQPYGCNWVHTPNFKRLAEKSVVFDRSYAGSLPCMPARRELHTGRYNFLHRSWGPIEPFDDSMPEILKNNGVYNHLVSDHYHYWEDGGATYHMRYGSWECVRGQENDAWKGLVKNPIIPETVNNTGRHRKNWISRSRMTGESEHYQAKTFSLGLEFLQDNYEDDRWFLHIETFDPHEPYFAPQRYRDLYPHSYDGPVFDWPPYREVRETSEEIEHCRFESAALHSMCDHYLGTVLDFMDLHDMWNDTMLIVNTDHGFMLGEHDSWAKCWSPFYNEVAHTPLFIWDPRSKKRNVRNQCLVQTIDLAPTLLDFFEVAIPDDMQGKPLHKTIEMNQPIREAGLFGVHGGYINCTDGRYVYMRAPIHPDNTPLYQYTLMPTMMGNDRAFFELDMIKSMSKAAPFSFTKNCPLMRVKNGCAPRQLTSNNKLFDLENDPGQLNSIDNHDVEKKMIEKMIELMLENDCPKEQFERMGLNGGDCCS